MSDEASFLAAICAAPEDDLPRLVMADWYEENGQRERAEFIRVQVEFGRLGKKAGHDQAKCHPAPCDYCRTMSGLKRRSQELWEQAHASKAVFDWFPVFGVRTHVAPGLVGHLSSRDVDSGEADGMTATVRRGFISEVRCTLADWCGVKCRHCEGGYFGYPRQGVPDCPVCDASGWDVPGVGPAVVRSHPVTRVVLTDREPFGGPRHPWSWVIDAPIARAGEENLNRCLLPERLFYCLSGEYDRGTHTRLYRTRDAALAALSAALIQHAKSHPTS